MIILLEGSIWRLAAVVSSNISSNLFDSYIFSGTRCFLLFGKFGGGNIGSTATLKTFSTKPVIIRESSGQLVSRQGLVFTSMSQVCRLSSIMKSRPNNYWLNKTNIIFWDWVAFTSKLNYFFYGSIFLKIALMQSVAIFFFKKSILRLIQVLSNK